MRDNLRRIWALTVKEFREVLRDNSSLALGILLPIILILVIGYGISLDVKHAPIGVVLEDASPEAQQVVDFVDGSEYFRPTYMTSMDQALRAMEQRKIDAILRVPPDFSRQLHQGDGRVQLLLYGTDTTTAMSIQSYVETAAAQWSASQMAGRGVGAVELESRLWFNDAHESTWYFLPGLILMIVTLVGVLLTAGVMAREYERGTFESLFVTPVKKGEIIVAKMIPYFCIAMLGVLICLVLSRFLFQVPLVGSLSLVIHPVSPDGPGYGDADFRGDQSPVHGHPDGSPGQLPAQHHAVRVPVRPAGHAPMGPVDWGSAAFQTLSGCIENLAPGR